MPEGGVGVMVTSCEDMAGISEPLLLTVCPVKVFVFVGPVPAVLVTVSVTVKGPDPL